MGKTLNYLCLGALGVVYVLYLSSSIPEQREVRKQRLSALIGTREKKTHPPFLICPASHGMVREAPASVCSITYSESDMVSFYCCLLLTLGTDDQKGRRDIRSEGRKNDNRDLSRNTILLVRIYLHTNLPVCKKLLKMNK